jgi:hypothetical protein
LEIKDQVRKLQSQYLRLTGFTMTMNEDMSSDTLFAQFDEYEQTITRKQNEVGTELDQIKKRGVKAHNVDPNYVAELQRKQLDWGSAMHVARDLYELCSAHAKARESRPPWIKLWDWIGQTFVEKR